MQRRGFFGACASLAAAGSLPVRLYERVRLYDESGAPLTAASLEVGRSYVFNYPYVTTPCFLLDLGRPVSDPQPLSTEDGQPYRWSGGVGPRRSLVAFSAICAHKLTHPSRVVSFINYRHTPVSFRDRDDVPARREGLIFCCSERVVWTTLSRPLTLDMDMARRTMSQATPALGCLSELCRLMATLSFAVSIAFAREASWRVYL